MTCNNVHLVAVVSQPSPPVSINLTVSEHVSFMCERAPFHFTVKSQTKILQA